ncbi:PiggyBac transposable element-derived protein 2, partial [Stegodyphus mimosarum]
MTLMVAYHVAKINDENGGDEAYVTMNNLNGNELGAKTEVRFLGKSDNYNIARQKGNHSFNVTSEEMRSFMEILIASGHVADPHRTKFWKNSGDSKNIALSNAMRRNRFQEIIKYLHFCDNSNIKKDKYATV